MTIASRAGGARRYSCGMVVVSLCMASCPIHVPMTRPCHSESCLFEPTLELCLEFAPIDTGVSLSNAATAYPMLLLIFRLLPNDMVHDECRSGANCQCDTFINAFV